MLHNVYYIMALRNSIISLKKLDNGGSRVEIDRENSLNLGPTRESTRQGLNHFYVLHLELEVVRPLYLATRRDDEA